MKKSEILKILKNLYPDTGHITVSYSGSNDSFSDFYDFSAYSHCKIKNSKLLDTFSEKGRPVSKDVDKIGKDLGVHNSDLDRCIWAVLDSHSEVGFDNDGCEGEDRKSTRLNSSHSSVSRMPSSA